MQDHIYFGFLVLRAPWTDFKKFGIVEKNFSYTFCCFGMCADRYHEYPSKSGGKSRKLSISLLNNY